MTKLERTRSALLGSAVQTIFLTWTAVVCGTVHAAPSCPPVSGTYEIAGDALDVEGVLQVLGVKRTDSAERALFIALDKQGIMTVRADLPLSNSLGTSATRSLKMPLDFTCKGGWVVVKSPTKSNRDTGMSIYVGVLTLRLKPLLSANDDSLQMELTFSGQEVISLFSYDSAHIDVRLPWSRYSKTTKLEWLQTVSRVPVLATPKVETAEVRVESRAVQRLLEALTPAILQDIQLNQLVSGAKGVFVRVSARRTEELEALDQRLRTACLVFVVKGQPVWTSQGYVLELTFPSQPLLSD